MPKIVEKISKPVEMKLFKGYLESLFKAQSISDTTYENAYSRREYIAPSKMHISHDSVTDEPAEEIHAQSRKLGGVRKPTPSEAAVGTN